MNEYKNASLPVEKRVDDLIANMTLREKVAQLSGIWVYEILDKFKFSAEKADLRMGKGIGQITRLGGASNFIPADAAAVANEIQRFLMEETRLGIPALIHEESCSGYLTKGATVFPQAIGIASSFEPELADKMGRMIREQMMALGARQALAPLLDITRDPRWGRTEETFGEDRYLAARMGVSYIKGLQGDSLENGILATGKHFVGYGASEGGMNWAPAHLSTRELAEIYLYPFEAAVREGKLRSVMPGYHELDGIPCHSNLELLNSVLRKEWGFEGLVVSDYFGINMIHDYHKAASDKNHAAKMALEAGVDIELPSTDCYGEPLVKAVEKGLIPVSLVERSVRRILGMKFRLGLFERPYVDTSSVPEHFQTKRQRAFSRRAAGKSIVLLKNDGILPLSRQKKKIAVVGPNADTVRNLLGDYSYPAHVESLLDMSTDNFSNTALPSDIMSGNDSISGMDTVLQGLKKEAPEIEFVFAEGCEVIGGTCDGFDEAVTAASSSDLVIAVMGDKAGLVDGCTSGETRDRSSLDLPGYQKKLLKTLHSTGTPIVLVLVNGRPLSLTWEDEHLAAILEAWFPGEEGAAAIASALFGDINPAGRIPISFPRSVGQVPVFYGHRPSGGRSYWKGDYIEGPTTPLYAFGHGLSYTSFEYSDLKIPEQVDTSDSFTVSVMLKNTGKLNGEEVAQLYIHDVLSDITRPVMELIGFKRVEMDAGKEKRIKFTVSTDQLGFFNRDMNFIIEPGEMEIMVGGSSSDIQVTGSFQLTGEVRQILEKKYETTVSVD